MSELPMNEWNYEPLTNDAMFHLVFLNNEKARKALVSTLLNIPEKEISEITVINPMQFSDSFDAMQTVLDLRMHLVSGAYLNIEMQVKRFSEWTNRTVVYSCRQITDQSNNEGFKYGDLEPVIHIAIMNNTLFENHKRFFAKYEVMDEEGYRYTDKLQFLEQFIQGRPVVGHDDGISRLEIDGRFRHDGCKIIGQISVVLKIDQILPHLGLDDGIIQILIHPVQSAEFHQQILGSLLTDALDAGDIVGGVTHQSLQINEPFRLEAVFLPEFFFRIEGRGGLTRPGDHQLDVDIFIN